MALFCTECGDVPLQSVSDKQFLKKVYNKRIQAFFLAEFRQPISTGVGGFLSFWTFSLSFLGKSLSFFGIFLDFWCFGKDFKILLEFLCSKAEPKKQFVIT